MKNIRTEGLEWRDKVNGNSYFSARAYVDGELVAVLPFQYGYGDHYVDVAWQVITKRLGLDVEHYQNGGMERMWQWCQERNIDYSSIKHTALKREVVKFGTEVK